MEKKKVQQEFGKLLKKRRQEKGISAAELGKRIFMERSHIARLEAGNTNPTLLTIRKLCDALNMSYEEFFRK